MNTSSSREIVTQWSSIGKWYKGSGAPNGSCLGHIERSGMEYELYYADYNNRGKHLYLSGIRLFQSEGCAMRKLPGGFSDGNRERINAILERHGITIPENSELCQI